jgi:rhodanese-related sulfurtransferase
MEPARAAGYTAGPKSAYCAVSMDHLSDFVVNHYALVGIFAVLVAAFVATELQRAGKAVSPQGLTALINDSNALVLDVRDAAEFRKGHITGSESLPYAKVAERLDELKKDLARPIVVVCAMGQHAGTVTQQLKAAGLSNVYKLDGGISNWKSQSLPLVRG